eukprot:scaffold67160_cov28-Tisochrysis_lutea.AAC.2
MRTQQHRIRDHSRRGVLVCARGQGTFIENTISDSAWSNIEVRGEAPTKEPEVEANELNLKKKAYASLGMLVPLSTEGVVIAGAITDESTATSVTLRKNVLIGGGGSGETGGATGCGNDVSDGMDPSATASLLLADYAKGFVKENTIRGSAGDGVRIASFADPDVVSNVIEGSTGCGVRVMQGGKGRLQNNTFVRNRGAGVAVAADGNPDVRGNAIEANQGPGVYIGVNGGGRFSANTVQSNSGAGLELRNGAKATIRANHVNANGSAGIVVRGSDTNGSLLVQNEIHANGAEGILLCESADPLLEKNGVRDNAAAGVRVQSGARGRLLRNVIERNGARGVLAEDGCEPVLGENYVQANEGDDGTEGRPNAGGEALQRERADLGDDELESAS